jgi:hypothetical protein
MAPEVAAALITVGGTIVAALVGVWRANVGLRHRSDARASDPYVLERRWDAYQSLWTLTRSAGHAGNEAELVRLARDFDDWYFANGLVLSGEAQRQWVKVRNLLTPASSRVGRAAHDDLARELSLLRSWLKADLNIRTFDEVKAAGSREETADQHGPALASSKSQRDKRQESLGDHALGDF